MKNFRSQILQQRPTLFDYIDPFDDLLVCDPLTFAALLSLTELLLVFILDSLSARWDMNRLFLCIHFSQARDPQKSQNLLSFF